MTTLLETEQTLIQLRKDRDELIERHKLDLEECGRKIAVAEATKAALVEGIDIDKVKAAAKWFFVSNEPNHSERIGCLKDAIDDIAANDAKRLKECYFGTKNNSPSGCMRAGRNSPRRSVGSPERASTRRISFTSSLDSTKETKPSTPGCRMRDRSRLSGGGRCL
jgi:hypothetical protein